MNDVLLLASIERLSGQARKAAKSTQSCDILDSKA